MHTTKQNFVNQYATEWLKYFAKYKIILPVW